MARDGTGSLSKILGILVFSSTLGMVGPAMSQTATPPWYSIDIHINEERTAIVKAHLSLPVPFQTVYDVFTDYEAWPTLFLHPPQVNTVERREDGVLMDLSIPTRFLPWALRLVTLTTTNPPLHVESRLVQGDFDRYDWMWDLHPLPTADSTWATLRLFVKPQFWTPGWLLQWMLRSELEGHFEKLRRRVIQMEDQRFQETDTGDLSTVHK